MRKVRDALLLLMALGGIRAQATINSLYAELERIQDNRAALHATIAPPWVSAPNMRGTSDILWSCLLTLFACIYTALHLNVPPRGAGAIHLLSTKCRWGLAALIAPEIVLFYASSQFFEARYLAKFLMVEETLQHFAAPLSMGGAAGVEAATDAAAPELVDAAGSPEVESAGPDEANTETHKEARTATTTAPPVQATNYMDKIDKCEFDLEYGFFLVMGGIEIIHGPSGDIRTLSVAGIKHLAVHNAGALKVSRSSIDDRSKADLLQKGLVLLQVTWMVLQCIARKASGLPITLLELHTMVHVVCAFAMYAFWLKKPLDVKSTEILDISRFGDVALDDIHFRQRGANIPGVKTSWILAGDLEKIIDAFADDEARDRNRVPTLLYSALLLPLIYGCVHLSAWNFEFPTPVEGLLWKISGIFIAASLLAWVALVKFLLAVDDCLPLPDAFSNMLFIINATFMGRVAVYAMLFGRIYILVEAFISLRAVPIGVYWTPAWIQMIPHV
ncbi:hypothetical protein QBC34DRAFT_103179 [Podospora aff. communis PSN243]|uniref:Uncharacterized protein n=1 Tax=Podospora aff. communis PSN243 TaxID=3040156 RepID=A0AAV9H2C6_9PEZI|nr:hypothetical protein QBC34DRAFT_103179 [Podospora aff. communis PSN243]